MTLPHAMVRVLLIRTLVPRLVGERRPSLSPGMIFLIAADACRTGIKARFSQNSCNGRFHHLAS